MKINLILFYTFFFVLSVSMFAQDKNYYYGEFNKVDRNKTFDYGVKLCYEAIKKFPDELGFHLYFNYFLRETKRYEAALLQIEEIYKMFPDDKDVQNHLNWSLQNLAWFLDSENKKTEGLKLFERAYKLNPDDEGNYSGYGYFLKENSLYDKANEVLKSGMTKFPDSKNIRDTYIYSLIKQGWEEYSINNFDKARDLFFTAFGIDRNNEETILAYGSVLKEKKEYQKAIELLEYGYAKYKGNKWYKPNLISAYINYADALVKENKLDFAEIYFKKAENLDPLDEWFLLNYGLFLRQKKEYAESLKALETGADLYPNNIYFKDNIKYLYYNYAEYYRSKKDYKTALKIFQESLTKYSSDMWLNFNASDCLSSLKRYEESLVLLKKSAVIRNTDKNISEKDIESSGLGIYNNLNTILFSYAAKNRFKEGFGIIDDFEKLFDEKYLIMNLRGIFLYYSGDKKKGIALSNQAYDIMIKERFQYLKEITIEFPLKGIVLTSTGNLSPDYISHAGFNRYCFDFMGSDEYGATLKTKVTGPGNNEDYYGFGLPIYSPIDGVVESVIDDFDDIPPAYETKLLEGNSIVLRDADGYHYLFYHNMKGSPMFKVDDSVKKGDILARIGNNGITTAPHLHFGVYSPDWLASLPVKFTEYSIVKDDKLEYVNNKTPLNMEVIKR